MSTLVNALMRRYLAEIMADPFAPEALGKAYALRDYLATRKYLFEEGDEDNINEFVALVVEAQKVAQ